MPELKPLHYAVIGAGPMGLAAAHRLAERGHRVTVVEAGDCLGGMSATFDFDGLALERYYHFICKTDFALFDVLKQFGLSSHLKWTATNLGFYYHGQWHDWGRPDALLKFPHLNLVDKLRFAAHVLATKRVTDWRALDQRNATQWIRRWVGERAYKVLWERLFELKFFELQDNLSAAWIGTRIKRVAHSRRSLWQEEMGYLEGGSQVLLNEWQRRLRALGAEIKLGTPVRQVDVAPGTNGSPRVLGLSTAAGPIAADRVLSTVPLRYVPRIVPALTAQERQRINAIQNIPVACALFKLRKPATKYFWMNVNDPRIEVPGFIEFSNLNPLPATVVYVPYYMPKTHRKWGWTDTALLDEAQGYLLLTNPHLSAADVLARHLSRYEHAQPICPPGFYAMLPGMGTSVQGFYMADTSYYYPEDRSINESLDVGHRLAEYAMGAAAKAGPPDR